MARSPFAFIPSVLAVLAGCVAGGDSAEAFPDSLGALRQRYPVAVAYEPPHALWTNGASKDRSVWVPESDLLDSHAPPPGSVWFKEIAIDGVPVETRVIRLDDHGPAYAVYLHDETGEASLITEGAMVPIAAKGFEHRVPATRQCARCHEAGAGPILGGVEAEPSESSADPETAWVIDYVQGNCAHCHNGSGAPGASFDLRSPVFLANTVGRSTEGSASASGTRVVPGDPEASVLLRALRGDPGVAPMPPLGVQLRDEIAIARIGAWIESLDRTPSSEEGSR